MDELLLATFYDVDVVVEAVFLTAGVVIALFIYSFQTTRDFSSMGASLFSILWVLFIAGILQVIFFTRSYSCIHRIFNYFSFSVLYSTTYIKLSANRIQ